MITNYCVRKVLRELGRCLALFPNMHTLKLDHTITTFGLVDQPITYGFGPYKSFPQIRSIMLPGNCRSLLKYVPGARYVYFREPQKALGPLLPDFAACCPLLENILFAIPSKLTVLPNFPLSIH
jgi:hypothetical protein